MRRIIAVSLVVGLAACGDSSSPSASTTTTTTAPVATTTTTTTLPPAAQAVYRVTITPNPILATASGNPEFPWNATWRVTITETAGLAGNLNRIVTTATNNFGFSFTASDYNPSSFAQAGISNFIPALGSLTYTDRMTYRADGNGGQQETLTVAAEVIDARGNRVTALSTARITFR